MLNLDILDVFADLMKSTQLKSLIREVIVIIEIIRFVGVFLI